MATIIDTSEVSSKPQSKPVIPNTKCTWRILKAEKRTSANGNNMLLLTEELCAPEEIPGEGGAKIKVAGLQTTDCIVFFNGPGSERPRTKFKQLNTSVKHPGGDQVDLDNPAHIRHYIGKAVKGQTWTESKADIDQLTKEPMTMEDGTPVVNNNYRITAYLGMDESLTIPADAVPY